MTHALNALERACPYYNKKDGSCIALLAQPRHRQLFYDVSKNHQGFENGGIVTGYNACTAPSTAEMGPCGADAWEQQKAKGIDTRRTP